jgi:hypothetical protein
MKVDYNNIGIGVLAIGSVLSISNELSLAKTSLILPFITHTECLNYLARATTNLTSIEMARKRSTKTPTTFLSR